MWSKKRIAGASAGTTIGAIIVVAIMLLPVLSPIVQAEDITIDVNTGLPYTAEFGLGNMANLHFTNVTEEVVLTVTFESEYISDISYFGDYGPIDDLTTIFVISLKKNSTPNILFTTTAGMKMTINRIDTDVDHRGVIEETEYGTITSLNTLPVEGSDNCTIKGETYPELYRDFGATISIPNQTIEHSLEIEAPDEMIYFTLTNGDISRYGLIGNTTFPVIMPINTSALKLRSKFASDFVIRIRPLPPPVDDSDEIVLMAIAGFNKTAQVNETIIFDASATMAWSENDEISLDFYWNFGDGSIGYGIVAEHTFMDDSIYNVTLDVMDAHSGVSDRDMITVYVANAQPVVDAEADIIVYEDDVVDFNGSAWDSPSDLSKLEYLWDFLDGTTATFKDVQHTYNKSGTYHAFFSATDDNGLVGRDFINITVRNVPPSAKIIEVINETGSSVVYFKGEGNDTASDLEYLQYYWYFVDGTVGYGKETSHSFSSSGYYNVTLVVIDDDGARSEDHIQIFAPGHPPVAVLNVYQDVDFSLRVAGKKWNSVRLIALEDFKLKGEVEIIRQPGSPDEQSKSFTCQIDPRRHDKIGVIYDGDIGDNPVWVNMNLDDNIYHTFFINFNIATNGEIQNVYLDINNILSQGEITFDASASYDPDGQPLTYYWDLADGTTSESCIVRHTYQNDGEYEVSLTVSSPDGQEDTSTSILSITTEVPMACAGSDKLSFLSTHGNAGGRVKFDGGLSFDLDSTGLNYSWDLGDGSNSSHKTVNHKYFTSGVYPVELVVTDPEGNSDRDEIIAVISEEGAPVAIAGTDNFVKVGDSVVFDGTASYAQSGSITCFEWNFDDGNMTNGSVVSHIFENEGMYQVSLRVVDADGREGIDFAKVWVYTEKPVTNAGPDRIVYEDEVIYFSAEEPATSNTYTWNFGDGWIAYGPNVEHSYSLSGTYTVVLTVEDQFGETDIDSAVVTVQNVVPEAIVDIGVMQVDEDEFIAFEGVCEDSVSDMPLINYTWDFGDGSYGFGMHPVHTYGTPGVKIVSFTVRDDDGETDTATFSIIVENVKPTAYAGSDMILYKATADFYGIGLDTFSDQFDLIYYWNFGDGHNDTGQIVTHTYDDSGEYSVSLIVIDDNGESSVDVIEVNVVDIDSDNLLDDWEIENGLNHKDGTGDNGRYGNPDGDGLTNEQEYWLGTDPKNWDTDGDNIADGPEPMQYFTSPVDVDSDNDGLWDGFEDLNGNGIIDVNEIGEIFGLFYYEWLPLNVSLFDSDCKVVIDASSYPAGHYEIMVSGIATVNISYIADLNESLGIFLVSGEEKISIGHTIEYDASNLTDIMTKLNITLSFEVDIMDVAVNLEIEADPVVFETITPFRINLDNVTVKKIGTNPLKADTDDDGLDDYFEYINNLSPCKKDADNDHFWDGAEVYYWQSAWNLTLEEAANRSRIKDFDDDRLSDGDEVIFNLDPTNADPDKDGSKDFDELFQYVPFKKVELNENVVVDGQTITQHFDIVSNDSYMLKFVCENVMNRTFDLGNHSLNDTEFLEDSNDEFMSQVSTISINGQSLSISTGSALLDAEQYGDYINFTERRYYVVYDQLKPGTYTLTYLLDKSTVDATAYVSTRFTQFVLNRQGLHPFLTDYDGDNLDDGNETKIGSNPYEVDTDGDGLWDSYNPLTNEGEAYNGTSPTNPDTDGDGLWDGHDIGTQKGEWALGTNPTKWDTDDDGLSDYEEISVEYDDYDISIGMYTDPLNPDTDSDFYLDGWEAERYVPYNRFSPVRSDIFYDYDGDGLLNGQEYTLYTDPELKDTDSDGLWDSTEIIRVVFRTNVTNGAKSIGHYGQGEYEWIYYDGMEYGNISENRTGRNVTQDTLIFVLEDYSKVYLNEGCDEIYVCAWNSIEEDIVNGTVVSETINGTHYVFDIMMARGDAFTGFDLGIDNPAMGYRDMELYYGTDPLDNDTDNDEVIDGDELPNWNADTDEDGLINALDEDSDNDGLKDGEEIDWSIDSDTDGLENMIDPDSDNDGVPDGSEILWYHDWDGDGLPNMLDNDSDSDGLWDGFEDLNDNGIYDSELERGEDLNCNGKVDVNETNPIDADTDSDGVVDPDEQSLGWRLDSDNDTMINAVDSDSDNDGVVDGNEVEVVFRTNARWGIYDNTTWIAVALDTNAWNPDADPKSVNRTLTGFWYTPDGGVVGDLLGLTREGEQIRYDGTTETLWINNNYFEKNDSVEIVLSNKPTLSFAKKMQEIVCFVNSDANQIDGPNIIDWDSDNDGIRDGLEDINNNGIKDEDETHPYFVDTDGDGIGDGIEDSNVNGLFEEGETDPLNVDTDGDGLWDGINATGEGEDKNCNGIVDDIMETDPRNQDSDGDGIIDSVEWNGDDTLDLTIGETNPRDVDTDDDGLWDGESIGTHLGEAPLGTNSTNPDSDEDGVDDGTELGLTIMDVILGSSSLKFGYTIYYTNQATFQPDNDPSTITDPLNIDSDNDGLWDGKNETGIGEDLNGDGSSINQNETDAAKPDTDGDGLWDGEDRTIGNVSYVGEISIGTDPLDVDSDDDGLIDGYNITLNGIAYIGEYGWLDPLTSDFDDDGILDGTELGRYYDSTNPASDNILMDWEIIGIKGTNINVFISDADPLTLTNPVNHDTDGDGIPDGVEDNLNNKSLVGNYSGVIYLLLLETDPLRRDSDFDGIEDGDDPCPYDADSDDDGIKDGYEANWDQDMDGDGIINALDSDSDGDGLPDGIEMGAVPIPDTWYAFGTDLSATFDFIFGGQVIFRNTFINDADQGATITDPYHNDTDRDGLLDGYEDENASGTFDMDFKETDPLDPDTDGDGLWDGFEDDNFNGVTDTTDRDGIYQVGELNPNDVDTDDDGIMDGYEYNWNADLDNDNLINALDPDSDGDNITDGKELSLAPIDNSKWPLGTDTMATYTSGIVTQLNYSLDADKTTRTDPYDWDTDGDGLPDGWIDGWDISLEFVNVSSWNYDGIKQPWEGEDLNCDGAVGVAQILMNVFTRETNPNMMDTDSDGLSDTEEVEGSVYWFEAEENCVGTIVDNGKGSTSVYVEIPTLAPGTYIYYVKAKAETQTTLTFGIEDSVGNVIVSEMVTLSQEYVWYNSTPFNIISTNFSIKLYAPYLNQTGNLSIDQVMLIRISNELDYVPQIGYDGNITFSEGGNQTYYLSIPEDTYLTSANLELTGKGVVAVANGDIDSDGIVEIIVGSYDRFVYVLEYRNGTYEIEWRSDSLGPISGVAAGDVDNDGITEIIVGTQSGYVYVFGYNGTTYAKEWNSSDLGQITSICTGDMDNDGIIEIIIGTRVYNVIEEIYDGYVYVFGYNGTTYVQEWQSSYLGIVRAISIGDIDNDNSVEIIVGTQSGYVYVFGYDGTTYVQEWQSSGLESAVMSLSNGDIDSDGIIEIVVGTWGGYLYIFGYDGTTYIQEWDSTDLGHLSSLAIGDVDNDGDKEIVVSSCGDTFEEIFIVDVHVFGYDGTDYTQEWVSTDLGYGYVTYIWPSSVSPFAVVTISDTDGDGIVEIVAGIANEGLYVLGFNGSTYNIEWHNLWSKFPIAIGDMDGDGLTEVAIRSQGGFSVGHYENTTYVQEKLGDYLGNIGSMSIEDVDGDGDNELIVRKHHSVLIFDANDSAYIQSWRMNFPHIISGWAIGDVDNDNILEIVIGTSGGYVYVFGYNDTTGTYEQEWVSSLEWITIIRVFDADGDNTSEILVGALKNLYIFGYDGTTYTQEWVNGYGHQVRRLELSDVDGDGTSELLVGLSHLYLYIYSYDGSSYLKEHQLSPSVGGKHITPLPADVNSDGALEMVVCAYGSNYVKIYSYDNATASFVVDWTSPYLGSVYGVYIEDVDDDGILEIVVGTLNGYVYIFGYDGMTYVEEWKSDNLGQYISLRIADINNDGTIDILVTNLYGYSYVFGYNGTTYSTQWEEPSLIAASMFAPSFVGEQIYPANISINIGADDDIEWYHPYKFFTTENTDDFADKINQYLFNHRNESVDGYILVPIVFHSDSPGRIDFSIFVEFAPRVSSPTDPDTDSDGLSDGIEMNVYNTYSLSIDSDNDMLHDYREIYGDGTNWTGTNPADHDTDNDGLWDGFKDINQNGAFDLGLEVGEDVNQNYRVDVDETHPLDPDTDNDNLVDGAESIPGVVWFEAEHYIFNDTQIVESGNASVHEQSSSEIFNASSIPAIPEGFYKLYVNAKLAPGAENTLLMQYFTSGLDGWTGEASGEYLHIIGDPISSNAAQYDLTSSQQPTREDYVISFDYKYPPAVTMNHFVIWSSFDGTDTELELWQSGTKLYMNIETTPIAHLTNTIWHHFEIVYVYGGTYQIWLDNVLVKEGTQMGNDNTVKLGELGDVATAYEGVGFWDNLELKETSHVSISVTNTTSTVVNVIHPLTTDYRWFETPEFYVCADGDFDVSIRDFYAPNYTVHLDKVMIANLSNTEITTTTDADDVVEFTSGGNRTIYLSIHIENGIPRYVTSATMTISGDYVGGTAPEYPYMTIGDVFNATVPMPGATLPDLENMTLPMWYWALGEFTPAEGAYPLLDFAGEINKYIAAHIHEPGFVDENGIMRIPLVFHSNTAGKLILSNIKIVLGPYVTDALDYDTDDDWLSDGEEMNIYGTNSLAWDSDNDGLYDVIEPIAKIETDPLDSDTENDLIGDGDSDELKVIFRCGAVSGDYDFTGYNESTWIAVQNLIWIDQLSAFAFSSIYATSRLINYGYDRALSALPADAVPIIFKTREGYDMFYLNSTNEIFINITYTDIRVYNITAPDAAFAVNLTWPTLPYALLGQEFYSNAAHTADKDNDGMIDGIESALGLSTYDSDCDDDGLSDGFEYYVLGTDPLDQDSDGDGIQDGTEYGLTKNDIYVVMWNDEVSEVIFGTNIDPSDSTQQIVVDPEDITPGPIPYFIPDQDPITTTDPLVKDTDDDGLWDGFKDENGDKTYNPTEYGEDKNCDGMVNQIRETDPTNPDSDGDGLLDGDEWNGDDILDISSGETNPRDVDTDDDGLWDGYTTIYEAIAYLGELSIGTLANETDFDDDYVWDGTEVGLNWEVVRFGSVMYNRYEIFFTNEGVFNGTDSLTGKVRYHCDYDPPTTTDPLRDDTDNDGLIDGHEDENSDGKYDLDFIETDPLDSDTDDDGLLDGTEDFNKNGKYEPELGELNPNDADTDDDGILDGSDGVWNADLDGDGLINALDPDSDGDMVLDSIEANTLPLDNTLDKYLGTDESASFYLNGVLKMNYTADADPTTTTDPYNVDTDDDGLWDGFEDTNGNGVFDVGIDLYGEDINANGLRDFHEYNATLKDTDNDGIPDGDEDKNGDYVISFIDEETDPLDLDTDDDGLLDGRDMTFDGVTYLGEWSFGTLPYEVDTDGDQLWDGQEVSLYYDTVSPDNILTDGEVTSYYPADFKATKQTNDVGVIVFHSDMDTSTFTSPTNHDTDGDRVWDGINPSDDIGEDYNLDGAYNGTMNGIGNEETDPNNVDSDFDGVQDGVEVFDYPAALKPYDCDSDDDGIKDGYEASWSQNTDGVGGINALDPDSDGDHLQDGLEVNADSISDTPWYYGTRLNVAFEGRYTFQKDLDNGVTTTDPLKKDTDNDGLDDNIEDKSLDGAWDFTENPSTDETDATNPDSDGDGILDGTEPQWNVDTDGDNLINALDTDSDNDLIPDGTEDLNRNGIVDVNGGSNPIETNPLNPDSDGDGLYDGDEISQDITVDTIDTPYITNPLTQDTDGDGYWDGNTIGSNTGELSIGTDPTNVDTDGDGLWDNDPFEGFQNTDGDEFINALDLDSDADGLTDNYETTHSYPISDTAMFHSSPIVVDTDNDGLTDYEEVMDYGTYPTAYDSDTDTLSDAIEVLALDTDPLHEDTDRDMLDDNLEPKVVYRTNALDSDDEDTIPDYGSTTWLAVDDTGWLDSTWTLNKYGYYSVQTVQNGKITEPDIGSTPEGYNITKSGIYVTIVVNETLNYTTGEYQLTFYKFKKGYGAASSAVTSQSPVQYYAINGLEVYGGLSPASNDTDGDGLYDGPDVSSSYTLDHRFHKGEQTVGTDPLNPDTDGDSANDGQELFGYELIWMKIDGENIIEHKVTVTSDPLDETNGWRDLDQDGISDWDETHPEVNFAGIIQSYRNEYWQGYWHEYFSGETSLSYAEALIEVEGEVQERTDAQFNAFVKENTPPIITDLVVDKEEDWEWGWVGWVYIWHCVHCWADISFDVYDVGDVAYVKIWKVGSSLGETFYNQGSGHYSTTIDLDYWGELQWEFTVNITVKDAADNVAYAEQVIKSWLKGAIDAIVAVFAAILDAVVSAVMAAMSFLADLIMAIIKPIIDVIIQPVINAISNWINGLVSIVNNAFIEDSASVAGNKGGNSLLQSNNIIPTKLAENLGGAILFSSLALIVMAVIIGIQVIFTATKAFGIGWLIDVAISLLVGVIISALIAGLFHELEVGPQAFENAIPDEVNAGIFTTFALMDIILAMGIWAAAATRPLKTAAKFTFISTALFITALALTFGRTLVIKENTRDAYKAAIVLDLVACFIVSYAWLKIRPHQSLAKTHYPALGTLDFAFGIISTVTCFTTLTADIAGFLRT